MERSEVTGVVMDPAFEHSETKMFRVDYVRNKRQDYMYVFAGDELEAFQQGTKRLAVMDAKEDKKPWPKKGKS